MRVSSAGGTLDVVVDGPEEGAPVLLLHGFPQSALSWRGVSPGLHAAGRRTLAVNQRGYSPGARPGDVAGYALSELVGDAVAVLDAAGAERAEVVGHDWGAVVAWGLAAQHPGRVVSLTAVSVPHPRAYGAALAGDADQQQRSAYIGLFRQAERAERVLLADGARRLRAMFAGSGLDDAEVDTYVAPLTEPGALPAVLAWYAAMGGPEFAAVGPCSVPTTFVWSDQDAAVGRAAAEGCAQHVTGPYRFVELPGVSHWIPDQAPQAVVDAVLSPPA